MMMGCATFLPDLSGPAECLAAENAKELRNLGLVRYIFLLQQSIAGIGGGNASTVWASLPNMLGWMTRLSRCDGTWQSWWHGKLGGDMGEGCCELQDMCSHLLEPLLQITKMASLVRDRTPEAFWIHCINVSMMDGEVICHSYSRIGTDAGAVQFIYFAKNRQTNLRSSRSNRHRVSRSGNRSEQARR